MGDGVIGGEGFMARPNPHLRASKPKNVFTKPLEADFKALFKALGKGIGHTATGKWAELASDAVEALAAIGLTTSSSDLAFLLIRRAMTRALFELVGESASQQLAETKHDPDGIVENLDFAMKLGDVRLDRRFLERPSSLDLVAETKSLLESWLKGLGVNEPAAQAIAQRLPSYFVFALNQEWQRNTKAYAPLIEVLRSPFARAGDREWAWAAYSAYLQRRVEEGVFDEPFSLAQIYVPLTAFYTEDMKPKSESEEVGRVASQKRRVVIDLHEELEGWLERGTVQDAMRVISGGSGSGKSSFARIFAAAVSKRNRLRVLFVPLHLLDPSKDLIDEVGRFVRDEGILLQNPLDPESPEPKLLIIFDGLDELASQGRASAETARAFVREVERTLERRNQREIRLRVLISGRELVVQENEPELRRFRQVLTLLPYFLPGQNDGQRVSGPERDAYHDPKKLLSVDLREVWWRKYGELTGAAYEGMPKDLRREDLSEVTAQPLLNYLVALSFTRGQLDFSHGINLNAIYADLIVAVHERGYERRRAYVPIRHMSADEFARVLEEIGLAAWHGDGRTTTVKEIEEHCRASGLGALLDVFQEGARAGVTRLLAAFFFRQYGQRASGDPTFVFTHKSFGEFLAARRIARAIERVIREVQSRRKTPDGGWDERDALKHWAQICGPSAISRYLHAFLLREVALREPEELIEWQTGLATLFSFSLAHGLPMEQVPSGSFKIAMLQARNAEEALLAAMNACARVTRRVSAIRHPEAAAFGAWLKRIQGQRTSSDSGLIAECLSLLDLRGVTLHIADLLGANLEGSDLSEARVEAACLINANLQSTNLSDAIVVASNCERATISRANLQRARLDSANLTWTDMINADLREANLSDADLRHAHLLRADLMSASLRRANLEGADLSEARLEGADLERAKIVGAIIDGRAVVDATLEDGSLRLRLADEADKVREVTVAVKGDHSARERGARG